jgi:hypothetical protein
MVGEVIVSVAYGIDVLPVNDPYVALAEEAAESANGAAVPGRFLVVSTRLAKSSAIEPWYIRILFRSSNTSQSGSRAPTSNA